ncbi:MAG: TolC family protein [Acidobacteriota bacterium]
MSHKLAVIWLAGGLAVAQPTSAQTVLTLDRAVDLAMSQHPDVAVARAREAEARGLLTTAQAHFASNPELELFAGPRLQPSLVTFDAEVSVLQRFELAGQRNFRIAIATAGIDARQAEIEAAQLDARANATAAFFRALHAERLRVLAEQAASLAGDMIAATETRYQAGDIALLDVNVARIEKARAERDRLAVNGLVERAQGELREVLALPAAEALVIQGDWPASADLRLDQLVSALASRPEGRALTAAVSQAQSDWRLAQAGRRPDLLAGAGFKREGGDSVVGARVGITLPFFQHNTGAVASAAARIQLAETERDADARISATRFHSLYAEYAAARDAAAVLTAQGLPSLEDNEQLAAESYRAGKISFVDLLVIRREAFATRRDALDAQLALALAATELRRATAFRQ